MRRLVAADTADPGKAHRHPRLVALAGVDRIERDLEHQALVGLADWAEPRHGVVADVGVEPLGLLVGEAKIGLPHGEKLGPGIGIAVPAPEGVVRIKAASLAAAALG